MYRTWQLPLAITERGIYPPEPADKAFVERFWKLLREADDFARAECPLTPPQEPPAKPERPPAPPKAVATRPVRAPVVRPVKVSRVRTHCVGCGCPLDDENPACHNCYARHFARRRNAASRRGLPVSGLA